MWPTSSRLAVALTALALVAAAEPPPPGVPAAAAPDRIVESDRVVASERVTAFDLLVEISHRREPHSSVEPAALVPEELALLWDGRPLPIVGLAPGSDDPEPWQIVVYVDRLLSADPTVRWAAMELAERADRLTALGAVEIVVADPEPRRTLAPTRDPKLLDEALSGIFLSPDAENELVARREEHLLFLAAGPAAADPGSGSRRAAQEEARVVRRQLDRLLAWLVDTAPPTPRRAVLMVGDGFDLEPAEFYGAPGGGHGDGAAVDLRSAAGELAETLGAYGWVVAALAPPPPAVGSGRFGVFMVRDPGPPWLLTFNLRSIAVWLDRNRNVKKADAFAELGRTLRERGELDEAAAAYGKSIYHYYDHPKTADRQAAALVGLGETLELRGDRRQARQAFRAAVAFDPELAPGYPFVDARLLSPREPLELLAERTAGQLVADPSALDRLLASLGRRLRLTSQLAGPPDGALHTVGLELARQGFVLRHPQRARWGPPPAVTALKLRQLLAGEPGAGALEIDVEPIAGGGASRLRVAVTAGARPADAGDGPPPPLELSWATAGPELTPVYALRAARLVTGSEGGSRELEIELPRRHPWLALVAEELAGGSWGGALVELPPRRGAGAVN